VTGADATTPLRSLVDRGAHGYTVLTTGASDYADGAEDMVAMLLEHAQDRGPLSDELTMAARTWPERYHLDRGRANVIRALRLPADAAVLEIGCGTGAVTSHLSRVCGAVDAVEPMPARARGASARTRDRDNVEVFVGTIDDVPAAPAYDLVVVVGVLEYVAAGGNDDADYVRFLRAAHERLRPGGSLVLAIENQLGVKYLCGAPEDHTGIAWDGVNGYPAGGVARTFTRARLLRLLAAAGFVGADVLTAFPDYKLTRAVMTDRLLAEQPRLAEALPHFPSPDWAGESDRTVDERLLWHELVDGGLAAAHGNSFLVLAGKDANSGPLWPDGVLASYFSTDRASDFCTRAVVEDSAEGVRIRRELLAANAVEAHGVSVVPSSEAFVDAPTMVQLMLAEPDRAPELMTLWRDTVRRLADEFGPRLWDLTPQNVLVTANGPVPIDTEWSVRGCTVDVVLARGVLITADELCRAGHGKGTVEDVVRELAAAIGADAEAVLAATADEARFQAIRLSGPSDAEDLAAQCANMREAWRVRLAEPA
jgi:cyclopropane fatty-acyl-phospholipid synthase-like methyltransferase